MSIQSEITRITDNVNAAYAAVEEKGGTLPQNRTTANLASAISSISGGSDGNPYQVVETNLSYFNYNHTLSEAINKGLILLPPTATYMNSFSFGSGGRSTGITLDKINQLTLTPNFTEISLSSFYANNTPPVGTFPTDTSFLSSVFNMAIVPSSNPCYLSPTATGDMLINTPFAHIGTAFYQNLGNLDDYLIQNPTTYAWSIVGGGGSIMLALELPWDYVRKCYATAGFTNNISADEYPYHLRAPFGVGTYCPFVQSIKEPVVNCLASGGNLINTELAEVCNMRHLTFETDANNNPYEVNWRAGGNISCYITPQYPGGKTYPIRYSDGTAPSWASQKTDTAYIATHGALDSTAYNDPLMIYTSAENSPYTLTSFIETLETLPITLGHSDITIYIPGACGTTLGDPISNITAAQKKIAEDKGWTIVLT